MASEHCEYGEVTMTAKAASEGTLGELHKRVAKVMRGALDVYDTEQEMYLKKTDLIKEHADDPEMVERLADLVAPQPNASLLSVITKFLADNSISCVPEESEEMTDLQKTLEARRKTRRQVGNVVHME